MILSCFVERRFQIAHRGVVIKGRGLSPSLAPLANWQGLQDGIVLVVIFVTALPLESRVMWRVAARPGSLVIASSVTFGLIPSVAWAVAPLFPVDLSAGLLIAACTPCTLASAAVWTRRAGGDEAVALLVTILTNLACFLITPAWLVLLLGESFSTTAVRFPELATKLALLVVLPLLAAQLLRRHERIARFATDQRHGLGVLAQSGMLLMVFLGAIPTGLRLRGMPLEITELFMLLMLLVVVTALHLCGVLAGVLLARACKLPREQQIAIAFSGSQKTLTVGLTLAVALSVSILPMIAYHVCQLFVDTLIADGFRHRRSVPS